MIISHVIEIQIKEGNFWWCLFKNIATQKIVQGINNPLCNIKEGVMEVGRSTTSRVWVKGVNASRVGVKALIDTPNYTKLFLKYDKT